MKKSKLRCGILVSIILGALSFSGCEYRDYVWRSQCFYGTSDIVSTEGNTTSYDTFIEMKDHCYENGGIHSGSGSLQE